MGKATFQGGDATYIQTTAEFARWVIATGQQEEKEKAEEEYLPFEPYRPNNGTVQKHVVNGAYVKVHSAEPSNMYDAGQLPLKGREIAKSFPYAATRSQPASGGMGGEGGHLDEFESRGVCGGIAGLILKQGMETQVDKPPCRAACPAHEGRCTRGWTAAVASACV